MGFPKLFYERRSAKHYNLSVEEYRKLKRTHRFCRIHKQWEPIKNFPPKSPSGKIYYECYLGLRENHKAERGDNFAVGRGRKVTKECKLSQNHNSNTQTTI